MKLYLWKAAIAFALGTLCFNGSARAQSGDNDGCSNASLNGDYAFTISGQIFIPSGPTISMEKASSHKWTLFSQVPMRRHRQEFRPSIR